MIPSRIATAVFVVLWAGPALATDEVPPGLPSEPPEAPPSPQALLDQLDGEPRVRQVQDWALVEAGLEHHWEREMLRDARARGALPVIRLRGRYQDGSKRDWDEVNLLQGRQRRADYTVDLWLEWDLADLASSGELLRAVREGRAVVELRQAILHRATVDYYDRRRLRVEELMGGSEDLRAAVDRRLRLQELDATLDGLTGGRWGQGLAEGLAEGQLAPGEGPGNDASVAGRAPKETAR